MEISTQIQGAESAGAKNPELAAMERVAVAFEASFLAEMLKFGGAGEAREEFGGGIGEAAFSSMIAQQQADLMAESGGIGLAQYIVEALIRKSENV